MRPNTLIEITQIPNDVYPDRNKTFTLDFITSGEINTSWLNLTDTAKLKFPRSVVVEDENGVQTNWTDKSIYGTSGNESPLFMRGDEVSISLGYYFDGFGEQEVLQMPIEPQFTGYISKIKNRLPIEIECEDEMWRLKQIRAENKLYSGKTLQEIVRAILPDYEVTDGGFSTSVGDFRVQNETAAEVLERFRSNGVYTYFRGKKLRCSGAVYDKEFMDVQEVFEFQNNIISDSLEYTRKEDLNIACKISCTNTKAGSGQNADGTEKSAKERVEVLVGKKDGKFQEINADTFHGDMITLNITGQHTKAQLIERAKKYLPKFYYTGFKGSFVTFGLPVVTHGNSAVLRDKKIAERSGTYLIKQVTTNFGIQGFRQKVVLHLRTDQGFTQDELNAGIA